MNGDNFSVETITQDLQRYLRDDMMQEEIVIDAEQNLLQEEIVDSLGLLRMVDYLEDRYAITIPPQDYVIDNFRNLNTIAAYVHRARRSGD
mgnify:CR=1 FL=1